MSTPQSRKSGTAIPTWSPVRLCECCGKLVVLLRVHPPEGQEYPKWRLAYVKGWDGNPWFVGIGRSGSARLHPRKRIGLYLASKRAEEEKGWMEREGDEISTPSELDDPLFRL